MATDPKRVKEIFLEAAELSDAAARTGYLGHACANDSDLRRRVEALLVAHTDASQFFEPASPNATAAIDSQAHQYAETATGIFG